MSIRLMSEVWKTKLPTSEKMVLLVIADHASDDGTESWPSQRLIAEKASLTIRTVQRCINNLASAGWLHMEKRAGGSANCRDDRRPNKYTIHVGKLRGDNMTRRKVRDVIDDIDEASFETVTRRHERPLNHPIETPIESPSFDEFYNIYPRKTAKGAAKKAWDKLSPEDRVRAVDGAQRYANDPNRDDSFTAYPATWLNAERWLDDPLPPRKFTPEEIKAREILQAKAKADLERERARKIDEEDRRAREQAVPMPDYLKDLLKRV
jgi:DNA-binding transcriptional regulator YhcF (GntR family)